MIFSQLDSLSKAQKADLKHLREYIRKFKAVCIAYSGGVDSSLVATISYEQLRTKSIAITGVSPALSSTLLQEARNQAQWLGILHKECLTNELSNPNYFNNPENRCFACKEELYKHLNKVIQNSNGVIVLDGVNNDDLQDYRPGLDAAKHAGVISPLADLKIGKESIRAISKALGLPWWDKPAQPCLASRIPYGETISAQRLKRIMYGENWLTQKGYNIVRVRSQGLAARIELPIDKLNHFLNNIDRKEIVEYFLSIGFTSVSIDLEGLISGKLNREMKSN